MVEVQAGPGPSDSATDRRHARYVARMTTGLVVAVFAILVVFAVLVLAALLVVERAERHRAEIAAPGQPLPPPPPSAPKAPREVNWFRRVWLAAGVAVLVAAALVAYAFWPAGALDTPVLEREIESWAADELDATTPEVDCPDSMPIDAGAQYHCILTSAGDTVGVTISVENDDGEVTWQLG